MTEIISLDHVVVRVRRRRAKLTAPEIASVILNFVAAFLALLLVAPVMIAIGVAIFIQDGGPPMFAHRRIGQGGRAFLCLKFRTMAIDAQRRLDELLASNPMARAEWERDHKLRDDPRVTALGAFLRRSSLDELPQLLNVLRGEMNLVGPRPIVEAEIAKYGRRFRFYASVKPGITGLWQVSGRNDTGYRARITLDCVYARRRSLLLDGFIILATVPAVLSRRGCY